MSDQVPPQKIPTPLGDKIVAAITEAQMSAGAIPAPEVLALYWETVGQTIISYMKDGK